MRTPGNDFELAVGFCFTDGLLASAPVTTVRYCATGSALDTAFNVVTVDTGGLAPVPAARLATTTSSCGLCGSTTLADLAARLDPLPRSAPVPLSVLVGVPARIRDAQSVFAATGGAHAAAAFDATGEVLVVREDIGRHNAVDKLVGAALDAALLPAVRALLVVSGRVAYENVQKAAMAGVPGIVAVGAPSSLAVEAAQATGLTLIGFARDGRFNVYTGSERLA
jgi:FdhD protein